MSGYGIFAKYYDLLTENVDYPGRAGYFDSLVSRFAPEHRGGLLLDLACGTGSLSLALDALGYEVIGADASADMLSVAVQKAVGKERNILFLHQSMTCLDLFGTVDIVVCALDSLNHLADVSELGQAMKNVALFLNAGGLFLFDVNTAYKHRSILADNTFIYEPEGLFCAWQNTWVEDADRTDIVLDFFEQQDDGGYVRFTERFSERVFDHSVLTACLADNGLELLAVYGDDGDGPPGETTQRRVYAAKKK